MVETGSRQSFGPNAWLVDDMYEQYRQNPDSVSESWQEFFSDYRRGDESRSPSATKPAAAVPAATPAPPAADAGRPAVPSAAVSPGSPAPVTAATAPVTPVPAAPG
ncbi:MAG: 2-oxoglutarate dehydrogenase E1 subunit family protein, partial [Acidimicrobiales bacterium]